MCMVNIRTIKVANGYVEGQVIKVLGRDIVQFLSIPYCEAPVGKLRFHRSHLCESFSNEVINNLNFRTYPPQPVFNNLLEQNSILKKWIPKGVIDEDSLYVNIWCPLEILNGSRKQTVFIFIYGGGFNSGSSSIEAYDGSVLSSHENIIVVTFNYRIGMLGFLCLEDHFKGNLGIWDQLLALEWLYKNISVFNGDPDNMTLAGCSAGGCSVSLHLLIKKSWPYFSKAIIESGVCLSKWALIPKSELIRRSTICVNKILKKHKHPLEWSSGLSDKDKQCIVNFLQNVDFQDFLADFEIIQDTKEFLWTPYIDGELIVDTPEALFDQEQFKKCPTILLNVENEGHLSICLNYPDIVVDDQKMISIKYFYETLKYFPNFPVLCDDSIKEKIRTEYKIQGEHFSIDTLDKIISDQNFVCDSIELANIITKFNEKVYYLWFNTPSENDTWPKWCGVMHGAEVFHLFGSSLKQDSNSSDSEKETTQFLMKQFTDFARQGSLSNDVHMYSEKSGKYSSLEGNRWIGKILSHDQNNKVSFWRNLKHKR